MNRTKTSLPPHRSVEIEHRHPIGTNKNPCFPQTLDRIATALEKRNEKTVIMSKREAKTTRTAAASKRVGMARTMVVTDRKGDQADSSDLLRRPSASLPLAKLAVFLVLAEHAL